MSGDFGHDPEGFRFERVTMQTTSRPLQLMVWGAVLLTILAISVAYMVKESTRKSALVGDEGFQLEQPVSNGPLHVLFQLPDFALTNQAGKLVTLADLKGQVWIADFIFTRCPGPCPGFGPSGINSRGSFWLGACA